MGNGKKMMPSALTLPPIPCVLQAYKVISFRGRLNNCGFYKLNSVAPLV